MRVYVATEWSASRAASRLSTCTQLTTTYARREMWMVYTVRAMKGGSRLVAKEGFAEPSKLPGRGNNA